MNNSRSFPHLLSSKLFEDIPNEFSARYIDDCNVITLSQQQEFLRQGAPNTSVFLIAHGMVEISSDDIHGQRVIVGYDGIGDILGDLEALSLLPCVATCTAFNAVTLLECKRKQFVDAMQDPLLLRNFTRIQVHRFQRDNLLRAADQAYSVEWKLLHFLQQISRHTLHIEQSQADIAQALGCTRQTVNRELNRLKDAGYVSIAKGVIDILDSNAIEKEVLSATFVAK